MEPLDEAASTEEHPGSPATLERPLGIVNPLLTPLPLGQSFLSAKFLYPVGAQTLQVADPEIFFSEGVPGYSRATDFGNGLSFDPPRRYSFPRPASASPEIRRRRQPMLAVEFGERNGVLSGAEEPFAPIDQGAAPDPRLPHEPTSEIQREPATPLPSFPQDTRRAAPELPYVPLQAGEIQTAAHQESPPPSVDDRLPFQSVPVAESPSLQTSAEVSDSAPSQAFVAPRSQPELTLSSLLSAPLQQPSPEQPPQAQPGQQSDLPIQVGKAPSVQRSAEPLTPNIAPAVQPATLPGASVQVGLPPESSTDPSTEPVGGQPLKKSADSNSDASSLLSVTGSPLPSATVQASPLPPTIQESGAAGVPPVAYGRTAEAVVDFVTRSTSGEASRATADSESTEKDSTDGTPAPAPVSIPTLPVEVSRVSRKEPDAVETSSEASAASGPLLGEALPPAPVSRAASPSSPPDTSLTPATAQPEQRQPEPLQPPPSQISVSVASTFPSLPLPSTHRELSDPGSVVTDVPTLPDTSTPPAQRSMDPSGASSALLVQQASDLLALPSVSKASGHLPVDPTAIETQPIALHREALSPDVDRTADPAAPPVELSEPFAPAMAQPFPVEADLPNVTRTALTSRVQAPATGHDPTTPIAPPIEAADGVTAAPTVPPVEGESQLPPALSLGQAALGRSTEPTIQPTALSPIERPPEGLPVDAVPAATLPSVDGQAVRSFAEGKSVSPTVAEGKSVLPTALEHLASPGLQPTVPLVQRSPLLASPQVLREGATVDVVPTIVPAQPIARQETQTDRQAPATDIPSLPGLTPRTLQQSPELPVVQAAPVTAREPLPVLPPVGSGRPPRSSPDPDDGFSPLHFGDQGTYAAPILRRSAESPVPVDVQRREEGSAPAPPAPPAPPTQQAHPPSSPEAEKGASQADLERLAHAIYGLLCQRIEIERERQGIFNGRLPW